MLNGIARRAWFFLYGGVLLVFVCLVSVGIFFVGLFEPNQAILMAVNSLGAMREALVGSCVERVAADARATAAETEA